MRPAMNPLLTRRTLSRPMRLLLPLAAALGLAACATPTEPRMQELGDNSYMVTVVAAETADGKKLARREAARLAEAHCAQRGQHARPTHLSSGVSDFMLGGNVELNFRCQDQVFQGP
jgi:putative hemolysin